MTGHDLVFMSAFDLAAAIRDQRVSALEVMEAHLEQIERHNGALNAVITLDEERALRQARDADDAMANGVTFFELHGVPVTLKDCHETAGMRTTVGHPPLATYMPKRDGTIARRLKAAGAIVIGKTNVSPLLADVQSSNEVFGSTNNPWDLSRTPGGSSGGAAAAVAAGFTPLEIGSDIGGSIRIPSHCCGIMGFKPTEHRVPNTGHLPDLPGHPRTTRIMNAIGPMARTVDDLILGLRVIAGPDGEDLDVPPMPWTEPPYFALPWQRIAWASSFPGLPIAADIHAAIEQLAGELAGLGGRVEEVLPEVDFAEQLRVRATLREVVRMNLEEPPGGPPSAATYLGALEQRDGLTRAWEAFFDNWDIFICPVMMTTAFHHCERGTPVPVDGVEHDYALLADYCRPFNLTGHPVVTLPIGSDRDGLPIGIQIAGKRWQDERLLGIARAVSEVTGAVRRPAGY